MSIPLESYEQRAFANWVTLTHPELDGLWCAVPNGGMRDPKVAANLKREGVRRGWPDLQFMIPAGPYHGLFIEMKRVEGGTVSRAQRFVLGRLEDAGYCCHVAKGAAEAKKILENYLSMRKNGSIS